MQDVARAVHVAARAYGSLDAALGLTPRQLGAVMGLEHESRSRDLVELFTVQRVAHHGEKKDADKLLRELTSVAK